MSRIAIVSALFIVPLMLTTGAVHAEQTMFWSDRIADTIRQSDLVASNIRVLSAGGELSEYRGVDIDLEHGYLYWADNGTNSIHRSYLDGTSAEEIVSTGLSFPAGVVVDPYNEQLYWADASNGKIQRSDLDGSNVIDLITEVTGPYFITLDPIHEQLYWTDQRTRKIQRANLDGTNVEDLVTGLSTPRGIALDLVNDQMYFADRGTDLIQRANLDGTNVETLVTIVREAVDPAPHGVALDLARGHLYWVDNGKVQIQRSDLDGSNEINLLSAGADLTKPWQIVLDLELQRCDFNRSGACDAADIDLLSAEMASGANKAFFNLDSTDEVVNARDHAAWLDLASVLQGDANLDGSVDAADFAVWSANRFTIGAGWANADFNGDGMVDVSDFNVWNDHNGQVANTVAVPEPSAFWPLALGLLLLRTRMRNLE
jgi:hypothetical protein